MADWAAVAKAVDDRVTELGWPQGELAKRAGLGRTTVREIQHHIAERRRSAATLQALSRALDWPPDRLAAIATSGTSSSDHVADAPAEAPAAARDELERHMEVMAERFAQLGEDMRTMRRLVRENC